MSLSQDAHEERRAGYRRSDKKRRAKAFGLTVDEYNEIMSRDCEICGGSSEHLDHCHTTGIVRGALCRKCNLGIGQFGDDPDILRAAIAYLERRVF